MGGTDAQAFLSLFVQISNGNAGHSFISSAINDCIVIIDFNQSTTEKLATLPSNVASQPPEWIYSGVARAIPRGGLRESGRLSKDANEGRGGRREKLRGSQFEAASDGAG
ncbi:MAG: hypothetical protein ACREXP_06420 [Steroidobacteraceae bacterium]